MNVLTFNLQSIHAKHAAEVRNNKKVKNMKFIKLNKFDKSRDLTWDSLSGFSLPRSRSSVIMTEREREEFKGLIKDLEITQEIRATTQTPLEIFIVEIE